MKLYRKITLGLAFLLTVFSAVAQDNISTEELSEGKKETATAANELPVANVPAPEDRGKVTGVIMDNEFQEPVPYATISIKHPDGEILTGVISTEEGSFVLDQIPEGEYILEVQFMGYRKFTEEMTISSKNKEIDMGTIVLEADIDQLDDVLIVAERSTIEQRIDRKIINVGKDLTTMGPSASDIMNNIPSVSVDQDGNIALRGSENVKILVDGRPTNMDAATLLKQIPSTSIKKIELITNPSAKYDPEGMSGLINIILHKNSNLGFNGDISSGVTFGEHISSNGNLNMNYRAGKFNFFTNLGANRRKNVLIGSVINNNDGSGEFPVLTMGTQSYFVKTGIDYYLNDHNTLSFYTRQNLFYGDIDGAIDVRYPQDQTRNFTQLLNTENEDVSSIYNLAYKKDFEKDGHALELEMDHNRLKTEEDAIFTFTGNTPVASYRDHINKKRENTVANLDYVNPLSENSKLEMGAESRLFRLENNFESSNENLESTIYNYNRNIHSFYATYGQDFEYWSYQMGARMESYDVEALQLGDKIFEDDYLTVYPSAFITYTPGETNTFQVSYSRRVDRPSFGQVNPVRSLATPRLTVKGNPELQPQFTDAVEFNYSRKIGRNSFTGGLFYRMTNNNITQLIEQDAERPEHMIISYTNAGDNYSYGLELTGNLKPANFWEVNTSFNLYGQKLQGVVGTTYLERENTFYRIQANNTFKVSSQLRLQLFGMYTGPSKTLQFDLKDNYFINVGARYSFLQDKASLSINLNDVFDTKQQRLSTTRPVPQTARFKIDSRSILLGFSYRFGGGENKALQRKQRDDNTARGGVF